MKKRNLIFVLSLFLIILGSCSKSAIEDRIEAITPEIETPEEDDDDNNDDDQEEEKEVLGKLTAKINDLDFDTSRLLVGPNIGATLTFVENGYLLNIIAIDLQLSLNRHKVIGLYISGFDFDELVEGSKFNTPNLFSIVAEPGAYAIYSQDLNTDDEIDSVSSTETIEVLNIEITDIDR